MELNQPDRWRGERLKLWGVLIIAALLLAFTLVRHAFPAHGAAR